MGKINLPLLKYGIYGIYQRVSPKHLKFEFRYNIKHIHNVKRLFFMSSYYNVG